MAKQDANKIVRQTSELIIILFLAVIAALIYRSSANHNLAHGVSAFAAALALIFFVGFKKNTNFLIVKGLFSISLIVSVFIFYFIPFDIQYFYLSSIIFPWLILHLWQNHKTSIIFLILVWISFPAFYYYTQANHEIVNLYIQLILFALVSIIIYLETKSYSKQIDSLNKINQELKSEIETQKSFLQSFSHQLRTPLNNIIGINDFFARTELDDIQQDYLDTIAASAYTLVDVVEILDKRNKVRFEKENEDNDKIKFNIYLTLNNFIDFAKSQNKYLSIQLKIKENFPARIIGNPIKLKQILFHVLESFNKYNSEKTLDIEITLSSDSESEESLHYHFEIKKIGKLHISKAIELEDKSQEKLLELLDIKIIRDICKNISCKLYVSIEDNYSSISLKGQFEKINRYQGSETEKRESIYKKPITENKGPIAFTEASDEEILRNSNVLLVEDNLINQKVILLALETLVANIDVANNGKEALDVFGKTKYDIILMDIQMPIMDGIKASMKIREIEKTTQSYTPIIAVTANALQGDENSCLEAGMDKYMTKPIQMDKLKSYMAELIRKHYTN